MNTQGLIKQQIQEMDRHKWIESEKAGYDLGQEAFLDWIENHMDISEKKSSKNIKTTAKKEPAK
ncbi:MAG: hypothetical protein NE334_04870 [Lentisphaeraceae bacterium]|nr:hypothetical protein [Lentisphaeraceae bacterium]